MLHALLHFPHNHSHESLCITTALPTTLQYLRTGCTSSDPRFTGPFSCGPCSSSPPHFSPSSSNLLQFLKGFVLFLPSTSPHVLLFQLELFFFLLPYPTLICKLQPTQTFLEGCMTQAFTPFPWILPHNPTAAWTTLL